MEQRLDWRKASPGAYKAMSALNGFVTASGLEPSLLELVKIRASQINGCAFCINMHARDARRQGESEERIYLLDAWHEAPVYTERERAALAWTDALTLLAGRPVSDEVYEQVRKQFSDEEIVNLTVAVGMINAYNRIGVGFRITPDVKPAKAA